MPKNPNSKKLNRKSTVELKKRKTKFTRKSVLKMLAVMEARRNDVPGPSQPDPNAPSAENASPDDFLQSGRTGRRNALADILSDEANVTTTSADLPTKLEALSTKDDDETKGDLPKEASLSNS